MAGKLELTSKGKPKDGYYYPITCSIHGNTEGICIGRHLCCLKCAEEFGKDKGEVNLNLK